MFFLRSLLNIQYCRKSSWSRVSVLELRLPGLEIRILSPEDSPSSRKHVYNIYAMLAQRRRLTCIGTKTVQGSAHLFSRYFVRSFIHHSSTQLPD